MTFKISSSTVIYVCKLSPFLKEFIVIHRHTVLFPALSAEKLFENNEQICSHFRRVQPFLRNFYPMF